MWISIIQSKVFTNVQKVGREKLLKKYPDINFTTSDRAPTKPKFPTVYIKKLQGAARGGTLEDAKVNAVLSSFQIEVTTNTSQGDAETVADVVADIMTDMGYEMIGEPFADNSEDTYRNVARYSRLIGYSDVTF